MEYTEDIQWRNEIQIWHLLDRNYRVNQENQWPIGHDLRPMTSKLLNICKISRKTQNVWLFPLPILFTLIFWKTQVCSDYFSNHFKAFKKKTSRYIFWFFDWKVTKSGKFYNWCTTLVQERLYNNLVNLNRVTIEIGSFLIPRLNFHVKSVKHTQTWYRTTRTIKSVLSTQSFHFRQFTMSVFDVCILIRI